VPQLKLTILCIAESASRLASIARTVSRAGYGVYTAETPEHAVAVAANPTNAFAAIVIDEDMVLNRCSVAPSLKAVSSLPILLVCEKRSEADPKPEGVDLLAGNASEQIELGLEKLLGRATGAAQGG